MVSMTTEKFLHKNDHDFFAKNVRFQVLIKLSFVEQSFQNLLKRFILFLVFLC